MCVCVCVCACQKLRRKGIFLTVANLAEEICFYALENPVAAAAVTGQPGVKCKRQDGNSHCT